jgi:CRP-like cAMP-binding protein
MATPRSTHTGNLLLDALPPDVRKDLLIGSTTRHVAAGEVLVSVGDDVKSAFFPTNGTLSILSEPDEETTVEASSVGFEGGADVFAALGALKAIHRLIGQVPGDVLVIDAKRLRQLAEKPGDPQALIFSYVQALYAQAAVSAACNAKHTVNQRAARWLLQTHDRVTADTFELKQEFLAYMLGVARPTVSLAAETLKSAGLIAYSRGVITIRDREGLESVACSCYEHIRTQYSSLVDL